jgi:DNA polymerase III delta prime subunit
MPEGIELPEHHGDHGNNPLVMPVSLTISILAVLVAVVTLLGHRAHTEELFRETQAASRWTQYQAKSIRQHEAENTSDIVELVASINKEKGEALRKKYEKQLEHYASDKEDVSEQAKELEAERDLSARRADRFDGGEALLEIGLVICSITLLAKKRAFWFAGMAIGAAGVILAITGLLLH